MRKRRRRTTKMGEGLNARLFDFLLMMMMSPKRTHKAQLEAQGGASEGVFMMSA
jgi:hypothetical protein